MFTMKISTKARYAVMAMMELAMNEKRGPVNLTDISRAQGISLSYLEQLFANLRKHELVKGRRGPGGGYKLGNDPRQISIASIISAANDTSPPYRDSADTTTVYPPSQLWSNLSGRIDQFLEGISLAECIADTPEQERIDMLPTMTGSNSVSRTRRTTY